MQAGQRQVDRIAVMRRELASLSLVRGPTFRNQNPPFEQPSENGTFAFDKSLARAIPVAETLLSSEAPSHRSA